MAERPKNPLINGLITLVVLGFSAYSIYQFFFGAVPTCDAEEVKTSLLKIFQEQSHIGTDKITADSLRELSELGFVDAVRSCQGQLQVGIWQAPFSYNLRWQSRWQHLFVTHIDGDQPEQKSAWYLLDALPSCDSEAVHKIVDELFAQVGEAQQIPVTGTEQLQEISFDADQEVRICSGMVIALEADQQPDAAPFRYQIDWRDKTKGRFFTQILDADAP